MGDFKILSSLDLDISEAEKKISSIGKKGIKAKLDLDTSAFKDSIRNYRKAQENADKKMKNLSNGRIRDNLDKELTSYRKMLNNKQALERAYLKTQSVERRNKLEKEIIDSKKAIEKEYNRIMGSAIKNDDDNKRINLNALTRGILGEDPFGGNKSVKELLTDMEKIGKISRDSREMFQNITGESTKRMVSENQKKNESLLKRVNDAKINDDNVDKYSRRARAINKVAKEALKVNRQEEAFNERMSRNRILAGKIENEELRKQAFLRLDEIQAKKNNISLKGTPTKIEKSFKNLNKELGTYSSGLRDIVSTGKSIEREHGKEISTIEKKSQNIKGSLNSFSNEITKDLAKNLDIDNQVNNILNKSKKEVHRKDSLKGYTKNIDDIQGQIKKLEKVDALSNKIKSNLNKNKEIVGSYLDKNVNNKANKIIKNIEGMYRGIDRTTTNKTLMGLTDVNEKLENMAKTTKHLERMDNLAFKINDSKVLSDSNKKQLLNKLYQTGFQNVGTSAFNGSMKVFSSEVKEFENIGRNNISSQKKYNTELDRTISKAKEIRKSLSETSGKFADGYKHQLDNEITEFLSNVKNKSASRDTMLSNKAKLESFKERKAQLIDIARLSDKVESKYANAQYKLESISNFSSQQRAEKVGQQLRKTFDSLDGGSISATRKNLTSFNNELDNTSKITRQLTKHDNLVSRLSSLEGNLKVKEINGFRKELHSLSKSDLLGTPHFESKLKSLNTQMTALSRYRSTMTRLKNDFKMSFVGASAGFVAGDILRGLVRGASDSYLRLDESMINIKKVADAKDVQTVAQIKAITKNAITTAKEVGVSSSDVQYAIATSLQSGMGSMKASMAVARKAMILANISDMNKEDATKSINTVVKSFNLEPLKKKRIEVRGLTKETTELNNALDLINHAG